MSFLPARLILPPAPSELFPWQVPLDLQIKESLIERTAAYHMKYGHVVPCETPELQIIDQLFLARQLTIRLIRSTVAQFSIIRKPNGAYLQATELGKEVLQLLSTLTDPSAWHYCCHLYDPRIDLFMECAAKRHLMVVCKFLAPMTEAQLVQLVDALNGFAQDVGKRGRVTSFKTKVTHFQAEITKRHKAMQNYFRQLTELYPYAHVIRMDFSYQPGQLTGFEFGEHLHKTISQHGEMLLEHLTTSWGSAVVGYAWKRDFAALRGYQYHLVAILDGPQAQELRSMEQSLEQQWCESITGGTGLAFNCHGFRTNGYRYRGLSAPDHYAVSMEEHLKLVAVFMTLTDGVVAFAPVGKVKPYGMGSLPKPVRTKKLQVVPDYPPMGDVFSSGSWPFSRLSGLV